MQPGLSEQNEHYDLFARHIDHLTEHAGGELRGRCPFHEDHTPSWTGSQRTGLWRCFGCGAQGNAQQFAERLGEQRVSEGSTPRPARSIVAVYPYYDEQKNLLYEVVRFEPKDFCQRRPDINGQWRWNLNGTRRVLYRRPQLPMADTVFLVEGEKDADRLWSLGLPATTNPQGAGKWRQEYSQALAGKRVVILPDNDEAGEQHAVRVAHSLLPVATAVKIVRLPELAQKDDVSDWLDAGHTKEELTAVVQATPVLKPEDLSDQGRDSGKNTSSLLQWYTVGQLRSETAAEMNYLVDGLLAQSSLSIIGGKIAVGKSTVARTLARCVMPGGEPFLGRTTKHGAVLYVAPEESKHGVMQDLQALGFTDADPLFLCFASSPDVLDQVLVKMQETQAVLVIFETIFRVLKICDTNDYAESTQKLDPILALARQTAAHVLFTHHLGKADREYALDALLGSTAIGGTPDTRIILKRKGDLRTLEVIQRYGPPLPETVLEFDPDIAQRQERALKVLGEIAAQGRLRQVNHSVRILEAEDAEVVEE
jgi:putative DNA primase/helicase